MPNELFNGTWDEIGDMPAREHGRRSTGWCGRRRAPAVVQAATDEGMALSQNVRFIGEIEPGTEFEHPPGAAIAKFLRDAIAKRGWQVSEIDNWRDCGWFVTCCRREVRLQLVIAEVRAEKGWMLQIAPTYVPRILGRILKRPPSATPDDIQALALDTHSAFFENGRFRDFMWCWDGFPETDNSTPAPAPVPGDS